MISETTACLWPRAIIDVIPLAGTQAAIANILRNFDPRMRQIKSRMRLDVTHLQSIMGPPLHIAEHIKHRLSRNQIGKVATMGVASNAFVAAYAAGIAKAGTIKTIAPWDVRSSLRHEPIDRICQLTPKLASTLKRAGIRTGCQITAQPLAVIKRVFGDEGVLLWHTCRGETNVAALEIDEQYHSIHCRAVLPPRTAGLRSIHAHLRRVNNSLFSILNNRQRIPSVIRFTMQEQSQPMVDIAELGDRGDVPDALGLLNLAKQALLQNWQGQALHFIALDALQLYSPSGQLDLFDQASQT